MKEKWFGESCEFHICTFENEWDKSSPVLVYCNNRNNKQDYEGNCNPKSCPIRKQ